MKHFTHPRLVSTGIPATMSDCGFAQGMPAAAAPDTTLPIRRAYADVLGLIDTRMARPGLDLAAITELATLRALVVARRHAVAPFTGGKQC